MQLLREHNLGEVLSVLLVLKDIYRMKIRLAVIYAHREKHLTLNKMLVLSVLKISTNQMRKENVYHVQSSLNQLMIEPSVSQKM